LSTFALYHESEEGNVQTRGIACSSAEISLKTNELNEDGPAANLWAGYIAEAERYDKGLVESWKSDMEGMLIFLGNSHWPLNDSDSFAPFTGWPFSASFDRLFDRKLSNLEALTPDHGDMTVALLQQILHQLAASANGTRYDIPTSPVFIPATASLVCNMLWFLSLELSLGCALIATLVEQWAGDFLHRANMRSAPVVQARIFSYLYYGLKHFKMHTMVGVIPLLSHASLVFFFAGLVAFLIPISTAIIAVAAALLGIILIVYSLLNILPSIHLDCPHRTPLSATFWNLKEHLMNWFQPQDPTAPDEMQKTFVQDDNTMTDEVCRFGDQDSVSSGRCFVGCTRLRAHLIRAHPIISPISGQSGCLVFRDHNSEAKSHTCFCPFS
jgi:hypothetical protein